MSGEAYTLIGRLGEGGMAVVYKALKKGPDGFEKLVAIKQIIPHHQDNASFLAMLSAEARLHAQLDHPNIVQLLDFFEKGDSYIMALEYVPGRNLRSVQNTAKDRNLPMSWNAGIHIICETLKALDFAHKKIGTGGPLHIVHRDVSPQNILLSYSGFVKLSDFGIARANIEREQTESGVLKGKQRYLAPEQITSKDLDHRADLFSTGVVLYELVCGTHPFDLSGNPYEAMMKIGRGEYKPPEEIQGDLPPALYAVIRRALETDREKRFQDAAEFRNALSEVQIPAWHSRGPELLGAYMHELYPKPSDRDEPAIEKTPLLQAVTGSTEMATRATELRTIDPQPNAPATVISGVAEIEHGRALRATPKTQKWFWIGILGFGTLSAGILVTGKMIDSDSSTPRTSTPPPVLNAPLPPIQIPKESAPTELAPVPIPSPTIQVIPSKKVLPRKNVETSTSSAGKDTPRPSSVPSKGWLYFDGPSGAAVLVNGRTVGTLPLRSLSLAPGNYLVALVVPGRPMVSGRVRIRAGERSWFRWESKRSTPSK